MLAALFYLLTYSGALGLVFKVANPPKRQQLSFWLPPISLLALLPLGTFFSPYERLFLSTVLLIGLVKCAALLKRTRDELRTFSRLGLLLYLTIWPGIDVSAFRKQENLNFSLEKRKHDAHSLFRGATFFVTGFVLLGAIVWTPEI